jgi:hypothetical protein
VRRPLCDEQPSKPSFWYRLKNQFVTTCADIALPFCDLMMVQLFHWLGEYLGSGPVNRAFEATKWRTYRAEVRAAKAGCLCKRTSA